MDNLKLNRYPNPILLVEAVAILMSGDAWHRRNGIGRPQPRLPASQFAVRSQPLAGDISVFEPTGPGQFPIEEELRSPPFDFIDHFASPKHIMMLSMPELEHKAA